ncbi:hypothetical protein [Variovorax ginsengisoli]|uniref:DNA-binding response OmpR family regulator n=1 Tax=Variovorax ginsengisoli TaxID=363844 RepID=A0ABT9S4B2_9BURK|nr:hypothetical protein [Variovorax ginsengisoli]MDP9899188.1 DNA-binding response OmpR family regulator [Variovorax ginsengisoli]
MDMTQGFIQPGPGSKAGIACESLSEAGISVHQCTSTRELMSSIGLGVNPIVVLDASQAPFPEPEVLSVIALLQSSLDAGILLITGETPADRVRGLNCGADACLSAPVHGAELVAQVTALHRRFAAYHWDGDAPRTDRTEAFCSEASE